MRKEGFDFLHDGKRGCVRTRMTELGKLAFEFARREMLYIRWGGR